MLIYDPGKAYKSISKSLDVHKSTVRQTIYKWKKPSTVAPLSQCGRPVKMTVREQCRMLSVVKKNPGLSAKNKSLAHANIIVEKSTISETLNKNGVHGRTSWRKPALSKKNMAVPKEHLDVQQHYWQNILWTGETQMELFGINAQRNSS